MALLRGAELQRIENFSGLRMCGREIEESKKTSRVLVKKKSKEKKEMARVSFRFRISLALIPCREIEKSKRKLYFIKEGYKIYK